MDYIQTRNLIQGDTRRDVRAPVGSWSRRMLTAGLQLWKMRQRSLKYLTALAADLGQRDRLATGDPDKGGPSAS